MFATPTPLNSHCDPFNDHAIKRTNIEHTILKLHRSHCRFNLCYQLRLIDARVVSELRAYHWDGTMAQKHVIAGTW